jgi:hypothetical protein
MVNQHTKLLVCDLQMVNSRLHGVGGGRYAQLEVELGSQSQSQSQYSTLPKLPSLSTLGQLV